MRRKTKKILEISVISDTRNAESEYPKRVNEKEEKNHNFKSLTRKRKYIFQGKLVYLKFHIHQKQIQRNKSSYLRYEDA